MHAGVSARRLRAGDLQSPFPGVRVQTGPLDLIDLCRSYATRMRSDHYFSHVTAAQLWGLPLPGAVDTTLPLLGSSNPGSRDPRVAGVIEHRGMPDPRLV